MDGAGKTTTIGKLANRLIKKGHGVMLACGKKHTSSGQLLSNYKHGGAKPNSCGCAAYGC
jgi:signal recognition particle GTPase